MSAVAVFEKKRPGPDAETRAGVEQGLSRVKILSETRGGSSRGS